MIDRHQAREAGLKMRWEMINAEDRKMLRNLGVINGCGPKSLGIAVPDFCYTFSCDHHDFSYWQGGTAQDRMIADSGLYRAMLKDAETRVSGRYARWSARRLAWIYYRAVRAGGMFSFHWGEKRGWDELCAILDEGETKFSLVKRKKLFRNIF